VLTPAEWEALRLSAIVALGATAVAVPPALVAAALLARRRFAGKSLVETVLLLPLVLPPVVTGFLLIVVLGRRSPVGAWLDAAGVPVVFTWRGCVVASAVMAFPLAYLSCRTAFEGVDRRLVAAARTLGASRFDAFRSVALPLAKRGVVAAAVLAFARSLGEFGATIVLAGSIEGETKTIPVAAFAELQGRGPESMWRLALLSIVLAAGALLVAGRLVLRREP